MPKYVEEPSVDLSCLDGEEFQVALRIAVTDLRDQEAIFAEFLSEAGRPEKSNWNRTVEYSHLHLLFAQTIVSTLLAESDRRIITKIGSGPRIDAATTAARRLARGRLQKSETARPDAAAPILEFRNDERMAPTHRPSRNDARIDCEHEIGCAIPGPSIIQRRQVANGKPVLGDGANGVERRYRWSRVHSLWSPGAPDLSVEENGPTAGPFLA